MPIADSDVTFLLQACEKDENLKLAYRERNRTWLYLKMDVNILLISEIPD